MSAVPTQKPAADPKLDAAEKAKLDYQLELDKVRMDIQRKPKWCEMLVEKGILAVAVVALGYFALWANDRAADARRRADTLELEKFTTEEAKQRFILEKKMDAVLSMETAMSGVTDVFFAPDARWLLQALRVERPARRGGLRRRGGRGDRQLGDGSPADD
jgi:hypothetical protein